MERSPRKLFCFHILEWVILNKMNNCMCTRISDNVTDRKCVKIYLLIRNVFKSNCEIDFTLRQPQVWNVCINGNFFIRATAVSEHSYFKPLLEFGRTSWVENKAIGKTLRSLPRVGFRATELHLSGLVRVRIAH
jgi:hypothetical protein